MFRFDVVTSGGAGHASNPRMGDNALLKLAPLLEAMGARQPDFDVTDGPLRLLRDLGLDTGDPRAALEELRATRPAAGAGRRAAARRDVRADDGLGARRRST